MSATEISTRFENITYEVKGSTAYITMNRPKVMNALNRLDAHLRRKGMQDE